MSVCFLFFLFHFNKLQDSSFRNPHFYSLFRFMAVLRYHFHFFIILFDLCCCLKIASPILHCHSSHFKLRFNFQKIKIFMLIIPIFMFLLVGLHPLICLGLETLLSFSFYSPILIINFGLLLHLLNMFVILIINPGLAFHRCLQFDFLP
jgi:hypothetical protein